MKANLYGATVVRINNGDSLPCTLSAETDRIDVSTLTPPRIPDPGWTFVDAAGHFHAFDQDGKLPTLRERRIQNTRRFRRLVRHPRAGTLQFEWLRSRRYTHVLVCEVCAEQVEPGYTFGDSHRSLPGRTTWRLDVPGAVPGTQHGERVSVVVNAGTAQYFGFAQALRVPLWAGSVGDLVDGSTEFVCWPMARRKGSPAAVRS